jgi:hypothetical protein
MEVDPEGGMTTRSATTPDEEQEEQEGEGLLCLSIVDPVNVVYEGVVVEIVTE